MIFLSFTPKSKMIPLSPRDAVVSFVVVGTGRHLFFAVILFACSGSPIKG
jgi:hypothetical protein